MRIWVELEKLCAHLENLLLKLLVGLDFDFLGEADDGLEVNILGFWCLVLLSILLADVHAHAGVYLPLGSPRQPWQLEPSQIQSSRHGPPHHPSSPS
jgi:hypothetical protein